MNNMTYELAKKLKDAGWPQHAEYTEAMNCDGYGDPRKICEHNDLHCTISDEKYYVPSLSELIEACGGLLNRELCHDSKGWCVGGHDKNTGEFIVNSEGLTPEEAVANLWLKLREK